MKGITNEHLDRGEEVVDPDESVLHPGQREDGGVRSLREVQHVVLVGHPERKRS